MVKQRSTDFALLHFYKISFLTLLTNNSNNIFKNLKVQTAYKLS